MKYPDDFPDHLKSGVEIAISDAETEFSKFRGHSMEDADMVLVICQFMLTVFTAFVDAACGAREQGLWDGERFRREYRTYLYGLAKTSQEKYGRQSLDAAKKFRLICQGWYEASSDWVKVQKRLRVVAENEERRHRERSLHPQAPTPAKTKRQIREPKPELLSKSELVNRKIAAEALGMSERTFDRHVKDRTITPIGAGAHKRFKAKELLRFLRQKDPRQE
jgi:hypothetical protein